MRVGAPFNRAAPNVPRPPLTPHRRELLARFVERFTPEEQVEIRARSEARGLDFLAVLEKNGDLRSIPPTASKKGNR